jgi:hypothetical protein
MRPCRRGLVDTDEGVVGSGLELVRVEEPRQRHSGRVGCPAVDLLPQGFRPNAPTIEMTQATAKVRTAVVILRETIMKDVPEGRSRSIA